MTNRPEHPTQRPALVTGASAGIGAATAAALAAAGHPVVVTARRKDRCEDVAGAIRDAGGRAAALALDVSDADAVARLAIDASEPFGPIEVLVSNAGDVLPQSVLETSEADFTAQLDVNLHAAHRLARAIVAPMVDRQRGDVVFVTSDVNRVPRPNMASYVTSKWGLEGFARALQMELEGTGVRASIVRPGPTTTDMGLSWDAERVGPLLDEWTRWGLMRHDGYLASEDLAAAILSVVSLPRGAHITLLELEPEAPVRPRPPGRSDATPPDAAPTDATP